MKIRKKKTNQASSLFEMFGLYEHRCLIMAYR